MALQKSIFEAKDLSQRKDSVVLTLHFLRVITFAKNESRVRFQ